jgi:cell division protein FtsB
MIVHFNDKNILYYFPNNIIFIRTNNFILIIYYDIQYQNEKTTSNELRAENERLRNENIQMKEQLKNIRCITCGHRFCKNHEMEQLRLENARLKEEVS